MESSDPQRTVPVFRPSGPDRGANRTRLIMAVAVVAVGLALVAGCRSAPDEKLLVSDVAENPTAVEPAEDREAAAQAVPIPGVELVPIEDFDGPVLDVPVRQERARWGEPPVLGASEVMALEPGKGADGSGALWLGFEAELDSTDLIVDWRDSYLGFSTWVGTPTGPGDADGVHAIVRADGFSLIKISLHQEIDGFHFSFYRYVVLKPAAWEHLLLPFSSFIPSEPGIDIQPDRPMEIELLVPVPDNMERFHFGERHLEASLLIDAISWYRADGPAPPILDDFTGAPRIGIVPRLDGAFVRTIWHDDSTEQRDRTPGIIDANVWIERATGGPEGAYLRAAAWIETRPELAVTVGTGHQLTLVLELTPGTSFAGAEELSLLIRGDGVEHGWMDYWDPQRELGFGRSEIAIGPIWTRLRIPTASIRDDAGGSLADLEGSSERPLVYLSFPLDSEEIAARAANGEMLVTVEIDSITLQRGDT